jgi:CRISPR-associated protein Csh1
MISAFKELGDWVLAQNPNKTELDTLIEIISEEKYPKLLTICLDENDFSFIRLSMEDTNAVDGKKYLYRRGSSRGTNLSPTALVTEFATTLQIKLIGWFNNALKTKEITLEERHYLEKIRNVLVQNRETIINQYEDIKIPTKENTAITIKIGAKYLFDNPFFKKMFLISYGGKQKKAEGLITFCSL